MPRKPTSRRLLATVLFPDIVGRTTHAADGRSGVAPRARRGAQPGRGAAVAGGGVWVAVHWP